MLGDQRRAHNSDASGASLVRHGPALGFDAIDRHAPSAAARRFRPRLAAAAFVLGLAQLRAFFALQGLGRLSRLLRDTTRLGELLGALPVGAIGRLVALAFVGPGALLAVRLAAVLRQVALHVTRRLRMRRFARRIGRLVRALAVLLALVPWALGFGLDGRRSGAVTMRIACHASLLPRACLSVIQEPQSPVGSRTRS